MPLGRCAPRGALERAALRRPTGRVLARARAPGGRAAAAGGADGLIGIVGY